MATTKKNAWSFIKLPKSNADSGHIFSMLNKIQRDMRSELKNDTKCASISRSVNLEMLTVQKSANKDVTTYQSKLQN